MHCLPLKPCLPKKDDVAPVTATVCDVLRHLLKAQLLLRVHAGTDEEGYTF